MQRLQKLLVKNSPGKGVVGISYWPDGIAIAIFDSVTDNKLQLKYCEFIPSLNVADHHRILRDLVSQYRLASYDCHVVLTADNYRRINVEAPAVPENEMAEAIQWKIADLFDFPIEDAFIDYYFLPVSIHATNHKMLEVFACPKELIQVLADKSSRAGLNVRVVDVQETTLRNLAVLLPENNSGVAMLILNEFSGTVLIQKEGVIYLSRNFDIGYRELQLDLQDDSDYNQGRNEQINLALEIQRSLDYVESYYGITSISGLAVIPMKRNTQRLITILNDNLGITAKIMNLSALVGSSILLDDVTQSKCAAVIGTTLRNVLNTL